MGKIKKMDSALCPVCHSQDSKILFATETFKTTFSIVQCQQCGLARTYPCPDDDPQLHDTNRYYGKNENKFIPFLQKIRDKLSQNRAKKYLSMISASVQRPKILDIGCAEGRLLNSFLEYGCECYGTEHLSYPKKRFLNSGRIKYFIGDLESFDLKERSFNVIILWHVLEHLDDPDHVIRKAYNLLSPNGIIVIAVPNFSSIDSRAFKQSWFHLDIPWHKYHFTKDSLQYLVKKHNLHIVKGTTFCLEQGLYGIIQSILNSMRWPRNELYEAMKGSLSKGRKLHLAVQSIIFILLLIPCFFISLLTSIGNSGSVLRLILKKTNTI
jgi:2-polyprenyl-3-methyl-5-hydroxy-6-metoxy-1,4-benzoquinol methylase